MTKQKPTKRSLTIPGVSHFGAPIPMGARVDNLIWSSGIAGNDPASDRIPADPAEQARHLFQNVRTLLQAGGASLDDVVRMMVYVTEEKYRDYVNVEWVKAFPDPDDRPARHTLIHPLRGTAVMQVEVFAMVRPGASA